MKSHCPFSACVTVLTGFFILCWIGAGCGHSLPPSIQKGLEDAVQYVESQKVQNGRLPSRDEFQTWLSTNKASGVVDYEISFSKVGKTNYLISVWRGERMSFYASEDKTLRDKR